MNQQEAKFRARLWIASDPENDLHVVSMQILYQAGNFRIKPREAGLLNVRIGAGPCLVPDFICLRGGDTAYNLHVSQVTFKTLPEAESYKQVALDSLSAALGSNKPPVEGDPVEVWDDDDDDYVINKNQAEFISDLGEKFKKCRYACTLKNGTGNPALWDRMAPIAQKMRNCGGNKYEI